MQFLNPEASICLFIYLCNHWRFSYCKTTNIKFEILKHDEKYSACSHFHIWIANACTFNRLIFLNDRYNFWNLKQFISTISLPVTPVAVINGQTLPSSKSEICSKEIMISALTNIKVKSLETDLQNCSYDEESGCNSNNPQ
jgi:hypothetical protein